MIPVVEALLAAGAEVLLAASGPGKAIMEEAFPALEQLELPGVEVRYPKRGAMMPLAMGLQSPAILRGINLEHEQLQLLIEQHALHGVISDNRYGLWSEAVPCVFITHQLNIQAPLMSSALRAINDRYMRHYQRVWVPDVAEQPGLAGPLVWQRELPEQARFIGPLSRFKPEEQPVAYDFLGLVSGPEPQRSQLEQLLRKQFGKHAGRCAIVAGTPEAASQPITEGNITTFSHLNASELQTLIARANHVVARSGYSTIMDLAAMNRAAHWIPTPGQTEQECLAKHLEAYGMVWSKQSKFALGAAIRTQPHWPELSSGAQLLSNAIQDFLGRC